MERKGGIERERTTWVLGEKERGIGKEQERKRELVSGESESVRVRGEIDVSFCGWVKEGGIEGR